MKAIVLVGTKNHLSLCELCFSLHSNYKVTTSPWPINPESGMIINFIYYKFTTILNNLKTQGTLNLNWTHWSLLLHSSLQSSQLETLQIISRNFILLTLSLTHSAIHNRKRSTWYNENIQHTHRFELLTGLEVEMLELNHEGK